MEEVDTEICLNKIKQRLKEYQKKVTRTKKN